MRAGAQLPLLPLLSAAADRRCQDDELRNLLAKKPSIVAYDGFEPSGRMHIAQGVMKALNVNKLTRAGVTFTFWVADWFALMNNKMGGDLAKIQTVGRYMVEVWKAVGMDVDGGKVRFVSSSEEINSRAAEYWPLVLDIARRNSLARVVRCSQIMGRAETDELAGTGLACAQATHAEIITARGGGAVTALAFVPRGAVSRLQRTWLLAAYSGRRPCLRSAAARGQTSREPVLI